MKKKQENYNDSKVFLPKGYQGIGTTNKKFSYNSAWGGRWKNGGEINNVSVDNATINKLDSLANALRNMQYEHTKKFKETYPDIPIEKILSDSQTKKGFRNKNLDSLADSLISIYGDKSIPASPEYLNTLTEYNKLLQPVNYFPKLEGNNESNIDKFGWRAMNYKYTHPNNIPAYKFLEQKTNGDMIRKGAPSKGKYGKKTPASAENGIEMQYYQQGLDFKPKTISKNGSELKKLDDLVNWTNYNIPKAEFGLDATTMMRGQNPEFLNSATNKLSFDFNKANTPFQIQQQNGVNNNLLPINTGKNSGGQNFMDSIGGIGGGMQIAQNLIGGIQELGAEKRQLKAVKRDNKIAHLRERVANLPKEQVKREYLRPEDNINTGSEFFPVFGVGTEVLAKNGVEIQNTYAPNTLYDDLEYLPKAENGMPIDPYGMGADMISKGITAFGGENAGGNIGGTVGKYAGMAIGGPLGAAIGQVGGQVIGGLIDRKPHKIKEFKQDTERTIQRIGMGNNIQQQYSSFMEDGGELKYISNDWLPQTYTSLDEYRSGGNLKADYISPTERALQTYALGGDIQTHWGGELEPVSQNPLLPDGGITYKAHGQTHDESDGKGRSGIGLTYGNNPVEIEKDEMLVKLDDGGDIYGDDNNYGDGTHLLVFGNLQIPKGKAIKKEDEGRKFKSVIADIAKKEATQNKIMASTMKKINDLDVKTPLDKVKQASLNATLTGLKMNFEKNKREEEYYANLQSAINDTAAEHGLVADDLAKGKIVKAKKGIVLHAINPPKGAALAPEREAKLLLDDLEKQYGHITWVNEELPNIESGKYTPEQIRNLSKPKGSNSLEKISLEDYDKLIGMYNKAKQQGRGKAVEEFQRAFSNLLPNRATSVLEQYPVTNYGKQQGLPATDLASNYDAIFGQRTEQYLPQIQDALNKEIQPLGAQLLPTQPFNTKQLATSKSSAILPIEEQKKKGNFKANDLLTGLNSIASQFRPLKRNYLDPNQLAIKELYEQADPVYAQTIQADLSTPYDISLQDMMPRFEAAKRSAANNPAALAQIEAQEQEYKNKVLGEQFRQNQAMKANVYAQNRDISNKTKLTNLDILTKQQDKQALAKSNAEEIRRMGAMHNKDMYAQNAFETLRYNALMNNNNYTYTSDGRLINMNASPNFNIPTVASDELTNDDYLRAKAIIKAYDDNKAKQVKALSKGVKVKSRNGDIIKSFKGY